MTTMTISTASFISMEIAATGLSQLFKQTKDNYFKARINCTIRGIAKQIHVTFNHNYPNGYSEFMHTYGSCIHKKPREPQKIYYHVKLTTDDKEAAQQLQQHLLKALKEQGQITHDEVHIKNKVKKGLQ